MLDVINRYAHGYVGVPVILACRKKGLFSCLEGEGPQSCAELAERMGANEGHLQVALRLLHSLGWLTTQRDGTYVLQDAGGSEQLIPADYGQVIDAPFSDWVRGATSCDALAGWMDLSCQGWHANDDFLSDLIDGPLVIPLLLAIREFAGGEPYPSSSELPDAVRATMVPLLDHHGWARETGGELKWTETGTYILDHIASTGTVASYRPMLSRLGELLFGDPRSVFERDGTGHERHVERALNVVSSGIQHRKYFADVSDAIREVFDRQPIDQQPKAVVDMGCGDGSLLKGVFELIRDHTERGSALAQHPLTMVATDFNAEALAVAAETLAGIPHLAIQGDIGNPAELVAELERRGVGDPGELLHIRSFLDHDRPFVPPANVAAAERRARVSASGVHVDEEGGLIAPHLMMQSLVEHLERWASVLGPNGLVLLEVHCLPPDVTHRFLGESESLHFDAYHGFSGQFLVEADRFLLAAAEAGLFPKPDGLKKYPGTFPFTRITLNVFERQPYRVRHPSIDDLDAMLEIENACWPRPLRSNAEELQRRMERYPEGQFLLEVQGRAVATMYSQRVSGLDVVQGTPWKDRFTRHESLGPVVQFLGLAVLPDERRSGLGDCLLNLVLQRSRLQNGIEQIAGVTRFRDFGEQSGRSLEEYLEARDDLGQHVDPIIRFHESHGAQVQGLVPQHHPADAVNRGAGVLITYDVLAGSGASDSRPGSSVAESSPTAPADSLDLIEEAIRSVMGRRFDGPLVPDRSWTDMGLDSLDILEFSSLLSKRLDREITPVFLVTHPTPGRVMASLDETEAGHEVG